MSVSTVVMDKDVPDPPPDLQEAPQEEPQRTEPCDQGKLFWNLPRVYKEHLLVEPFFERFSVPNRLTSADIRYFVGGLLELSQLCHEIVINTPVKGYRVNLVLREFLIFQLDHFVELTFRDRIFMDSLRSVRKNDDAVRVLILFLKQCRSVFLSRWDQACDAKLDALSSDTLKNRWVVAQSLADSISIQASLVEELDMRLCVDFPFSRQVELSLCNANVPKSAYLAFVTVSVIFAAAVIVLVWCGRGSAMELYTPILVTVMMVYSMALAFILFIIAYRSSSIMTWYARELGTNHAKSYFEDDIRKRSAAAKEKVIEFFLHSSDKTAVRTLSLKASLVNRQVLLVGVIEDPNLTVCSWNYCAHQATDVPPDQAIGKSISALVDPQSLPFVKNLFRGVSETCSEQKRIVFNSIRKGKVAVKAIATKAEVDGMRINLLVGTVLEEEEQAMMSYYSASALCALTRKLNEIGVIDPYVREIITANGWNALKVRSTQAIRYWKHTVLSDHLASLRELESTRPFQLWHDSKLPAEFFSSSGLIQNVVRLLFRACSGDDASTPLDIKIFYLCYKEEECELMLARFELPSPGFFREKMRNRVIEAVNNFAFVMSASANVIETLFPISQSPVSTQRDALSTIARSDLHMFVCTFIIYEPEPVYRMHLGNYCSDSQDRFFIVESVEALNTLLDDLGTDVSAALLSEGEPLFDEMVKVCRAHGATVVVCREFVEDPRRLVSESHEGPPQHAGSVDFVLHKPIKSASWTWFLTFLRDIRKQQRTIGAPAVHECQHVQDLVKNANSSIEVVRDVITNGIMVRKTVRLQVGYRSHESVTNEVEIMSRLGSHQCIVRYISSNMPEPGVFCIYMEYCQLGAIDDYLSKRPTHLLTMKQLKPYARQLLCAVAHLQENGIAHRDIKPANVFLYDEAQLKLGDFGSATRQASHGGVLAGGTLQYSAPERFLNSNGTDWTDDPMRRLYAEDMWSVGMTLLSLVRELPSLMRQAITTPDMLDVFVKLRQKNMELPINIAGDPETPGLSTMCKRFLRRMLTMDPSLRPMASELLTDPFLTSETVVAEESLRESQLSQNLFSQPSQTGNSAGTFTQFTAGDTGDLDDEDACVIINPLTLFPSRSTEEGRWREEERRWV